METDMPTTDEFVILGISVKPKVRQAKLQGRDYDVVPCVMILEGVHNGSKGPLYYPADEIRKSAPLWDSKPVVVYHPLGETACDEKVLNECGVGMLMRTRAVGKDAKLKTESWVERSRVADVNKDVADAVKNGTSLEASTGMRVEVEWTKGEWKGTPYVGIVHNIQPDHYAILPDQKAACSRDKGAGFLMNQAGEDVENAEGLDDSNVQLDNILSFDTVRDQLSSLVRRGDDGKSISVYVEEVFPAEFVFRKEQQLYRQGYEVKDDVVSLRGLPELVVRVVTYKSQSVVGNEEPDTMDKKLVDELVGVKNGGYEDADRKELEALSEKMLRVMIVNAQAKAGAAGAQPPKTPATLQEYLKTVPPEYSPVVTNGVAVYNRDKAAVVQKIKACPRSKYTDEQLQNKELPELETIVALVEVPASQVVATNDFGGNGNLQPVANATADDELALPEMQFGK